MNANPANSSKVKGSSKGTIESKSNRGIAYTIGMVRHHNNSNSNTLEPRLQGANTTYNVNIDATSSYKRVKGVTKFSSASRDTPPTVTVASGSVDDGE